MKNLNLDVNNTMVLLIGVSKYIDDNSINAIPNVKKNISLLEDNFLKNKVLNITENNLTVSLNETKTEIERKLIKITREANNRNTTLIVYYSGHGIMSSQDFSLYLTATNTTTDYLETDGININRFREIIESSKASRKIVIIDACHSGAIHNAMNVSSSQLQSELNKFEGTYVLTSSSEDKPSLYPVDKPKSPTYFTGELLNVLETGINNNNPYITLRDIYEQIESSFREKGNIPLPQQSSFQNADKIIFAVNNSYNVTNEAVQEVVFVPFAFSKIDQKPKRERFMFFNKVASFLL